MKDRNEMLKKMQQDEVAIRYYEKRIAGRRHSTIVDEMLIVMANRAGELNALREVEELVEEREHLLAEREGLVERIQHLEALLKKQEQHGDWRCRDTEEALAAALMERDHYKAIVESVRELVDIPQMGGQF